MSSRPKDSANSAARHPSSPGTTSTMHETDIHTSTTDGAAQPAAPPPVVEPDTVTVSGQVREASVPPLAAPVTSGSLADIPFTNADEAPTAPVLARPADGGWWRDVTAREFAGEVRALARGLIAHGLQPGDRIAIMARTSYEWTLLDFASWAVGLVTVPVYPTSSASQARFILQDAGVRACAVEDVTQARMLSQQRGNLPDLELLWQLSTGALRQITDAGQHTPAQEVTDRRAQLRPEHIATLIYTSGTTGPPKGCALTHGNFFAEVDNAIELLYPIFNSWTGGSPSTLLYLPLSHVFGRMVAVACMRARVRTGHLPSTATEELLEGFRTFQPTFLLGIPYVLEKVYNTARATAETMGRGSSFDRGARIARRYGTAVEQQEHGRGSGPGSGLRAARRLYDMLIYRRIRAALGGSCRHIICGGSPLGRQLAAFYEGAGISVYEGYGLTETTAAATTTPPQRPRLGTVGWPMPGTAVRIADDGEVLLNGGQVFAGYWHAADRCAYPDLTDDSWFATGDIGELDQDGYLTITGRKKDLIITTGGKNLYPAPLEDWLRAHPLVSQCLVVGDNRPYITALLTLEPDGLRHWARMHGKQQLSARDLAADEDLYRNLQQAVNEANSLVSRAESIRSFTVLTTDFTEHGGHLTPSLKLRRSAILQDFATEIDTMYAGYGDRR